jgi:hypothetical protein
MDDDDDESGLSGAGVKYSPVTSSMGASATFGL